MVPSGSRTPLHISCDLHQQLKALHWQGTVPASMSMSLQLSAAFDEIAANTSVPRHLDHNTQLPLASPQEGFDIIAGKAVILVELILFPPSAISGTDSLDPFGAKCTSARLEAAMGQLPQVPLCSDKTPFQAPTTTFKTHHLMPDKIACMDHEVDPAYHQFRKRDSAGQQPLCFRQSVVRARNPATWSWETPRSSREYPCLPGSKDDRLGKIALVRSPW